MARVCHGNGVDHCCYLQGNVCPFLEENTIPGRRWVCGLLRELGSWDAVHADPRYIETVDSVFAGIVDEHGNRLIQSCGDWRGSAGKQECCFSDNNPPIE